MRHAWSLLLLPFVLLGAYPVGLPSVAADERGHEETELRLKTAGIDEAMREEIHAAIRKGVVALRKLQSKNGAILFQGGQTVLGGLALTHAAIPHGAEGGRLALDWLMRHARKELRNQTYQTGLGCMFFQANGVKRAKHKFLMLMHDRLRRAPKSP